jgi:hypothetical protein
MLAKEWIDQTAHQLMELVVRFQALAYQHCKTQRTTPNGTHFSKRTVDRKWKAEARRVAACTKAIAALNSSPGTQLTPAEIIRTELHPWHQSAASEYLQGSHDDVLATLRKTMKEALAALKHIRVTKIREGMQRAKARFRYTLATKPKRAHQQMFGKTVDVKGVPAILTPNGQQITDPAGIHQEVQRAWQHKLQPPTPKTGMYLPQDKKQDAVFPWERRESNGEGPMKVYARCVESQQHRLAAQRERQRL